MTKESNPPVNSKADSNKSKTEQKQAALTTELLEEQLNIDQAKPVASVQREEIQ